MSEKRDHEHDPLGLNATDQAIRINELNEQLHAMGMRDSGVSDDCPPEIQATFLNSIIEFESAPLTTPFSRLERRGISLPAPAELDDAALSAKLWVVINALAEMNSFLSHTNHLSDRQLYEHLWSDTLREETAELPPGSGWRNYLDMIGGGSDEDIDIGLRYYDTEEQRQWWAKDFPTMVIPPHEDPPFDRDRLLPTPPNDIPEMGDLDFVDDDMGEDEQP